MHILLALVHQLSQELAIVLTQMGSFGNLDCDPSELFELFIVLMTSFSIILSYQNPNIKVNQYSICLFFKFPYHLPIHNIGCRSIFS